MRLRSKWLMGALLLAACGAAAQVALAADAGSRRVLPVLVRVDAHGKVTDVSPAWKVSPRLERLVRTTLDQMITRPAHYKGRAVASQFVINLRAESTRRADGRFDVRLAYVSAKPVPSGSWYWVDIDGRRLALADRDAIHQRRYFMHRDDARLPRWVPRYPAPTAPVARPSSQSMPRAALPGGTGGP